MARTVVDQKIGSRSARLKLKPRKEPYWRAIETGHAIGYRRLKGQAGTWTARAYDGNDYRYKALGNADDIDGATGALDFTSAQRKAREWFADLARADAPSAHGVHTVGDVLDRYLADYKRRGGRALQSLEWTINGHVRPKLGSVEITKLTKGRIERWHADIAAEAPRLRTKAGARQRQHAPLDESEEGTRRRRSSANRILTVLKAALNFACGSGPWGEVKPFRGADAAKVRYLTDDESRRLVNACPPDLRKIVTGALVTGARYGELAALTASDFNPDSGTIRILRSKGGKPRHIVLTDEGRRFFEQMAAGKTSDEMLFRRASGAPWKRADQFRPMKDASKAAGIVPWVGFHILRHTYGSRLAMAGVPMPVIAQQLGHADTRMTERHYAHLAPSYVADTVRAAFGPLGVVQQSNVTVLAPKAP